MDKKEEAADQLGRHSPSNKFCEDYFCSPVGQGAVPEEQVSESVEVFHLDVGAGEHVRLLVVLDEAHRNVSLFNRELVSLLGDHADHVSEFALDGELPDSPH